MASAALTPRAAPMTTMAVLMYSSGRVASFKVSAYLGKKFPTMSPTMRAMIYPASPVRFKDQPIPILLSLSGVAAM
jgi:hypothetical protein